MGYFSGKDGSLYVDGTRLARVSGWSLSASVEALETTDLGASERSYAHGLKAATGSASIFYYEDAPKTLLSKVIRSGPAWDGDYVYLSLRWATKKVSFKALITQSELACQVGGIMQAVINFNVTGDYTEVAL